MRLNRNGRMIRYLKVLWLPVVILLMMVIEPYLGILNTPYEWVYLGFQVLLFMIYTLIIYKDRPLVPVERKLKGKRKPGKK